MLNLKNSAVCAIAVLCACLALLTPDWKIMLMAHEPGYQNSDYKGNGTSDVLFLNANTGGSQYWDGAIKALVTYPGTYDKTFAYAASGDFNGDGKDDILFTRVSDGKTTIWPDAVKASAISPGTSTRGFKVAAACDVNGDGTSDIVWVNYSTGVTQIWPSAVKSSATFPGAQAANNYVATCSDFDGDGAADLFWQNYNTGTTEIWLSANPSTKLNPGTIDLNWLVIGSGDVDGDGTSDVVWYKTGNSSKAGSIKVWGAGLQSNTTQIGQESIYGGNVPMTVADYNGDGLVDLLWMNKYTRQIKIWPNLQKSAATYPGTVPSGYAIKPAVFY